MGLKDKWRRELHKPNLPLYRMLTFFCNWLEGDFIEMGVGDGKTFAQIYANAVLANKPVIGIDTFEGMPPPESPGDEMYPKGMFNNYALSGFQIDYPKAAFLKGVIPEVLADVDIPEIAFCHIDLDHRNSTKAALEWVWPRMSDGGILVCHDFRWDIKVRASGAIQDWMAENDIVHIGLCDLSIWFQKGVS